LQTVRASAIVSASSSGAQGPVDAATNVYTRD